MDGTDLADAIEMLRAQIEAAHSKAAAADVQFPIQSLTVTLNVGLTHEAGGKIGFKVPFWGAGAEVSGDVKRATTQTLTLVLGPPVNRAGQPVNVGQGSSQKPG